MRGGRIETNSALTPDAEYAIELELDLATVVPHVSGPNEVKTMVSLPEIERKHVPIQKAYLLSCVNARFEDLHDAAEVVRARGGHVADGVEFYLAPASAEVQAKSERNGDWQTLLGAGAIALPPGCGACIGLGRGLVQKGETAISSTNRNFKGRMGDRDALVYLGSPAVVAASALAGFICAPQTFAERAAGTAIRRAERKAQSAGSVEIIAGFPPSVRGRVLFVDKDNLNTDGIYGSKHTYRDDMTPEEMAAVTFENYDPNFNTLYRSGDVVVGGLNFGSGSSREQAATALKFKGIPCVIAASFSETYKRNAFNNGFVVFECPELVTHLRATLKDRAPTTVASEIKIDYGKSILTIDGTIIRFSAAQSRRSGIDRRRRRRKSGGQSASWKADRIISDLSRDATAQPAATTAEACGLRWSPITSPPWLNTKLHGCRVTELATMLWRRLVWCWIG